MYFIFNLHTSLFQTCLDIESFLKVKHPTLAFLLRHDLLNLVLQFDGLTGKLSKPFAEGSVQLGSYLYVTLTILNHLIR